MNLFSGKTAPPVKRDLLRHRDYKVDLESKLGKTIVITKTTPQAEMGGYEPGLTDVLVGCSVMEAKTSTSCCAAASRRTQTESIA